MRLEHLPILLGVLVALAGAALVADAWIPDGQLVPRERRRRPRAERSRPGEATIGAGLLALAAALMGADHWRWGTVAVLLGVVLLVAGVAMSHRYLREAVLYRGAARRQSGREPRPLDQRPPSAPPDGAGRR